MSLHSILVLKKSNIIAKKRFYVIHISMSLLYLYLIFNPQISFIYYLIIIVSAVYLI